MTAPNSLPPQGAPVTPVPQVAPTPPPLAKISPRLVLVAMALVAAIGVGTALFIIARGGPNATADALEVAKYLSTPLAFLWAVYQTAHNSKAIQAIHVDVNSRLSQLLATTAEAARAEGHEAGRVTAAKEMQGGGP